jgi:hypothetical protein
MFFEAMLFEEQPSSHAIAQPSFGRDYKGQYRQNPQYSLLPLGMSRVRSEGIKS